MFTGLVEEIGRLRSVAAAGPGSRIAIDCAVVTDGLRLGDSVSVSGVCLTAVSHDERGFAVDCVAETLGRTSLGSLAPGDPVNLERALRVGDRMGGHIVQGHVDGVGEVVSCLPEGEGSRLRVRLAPDLMGYVVEKGSIALDGVSLTVAERHADGVSIALIPHTMAQTTLGPQRVGTPINIEVDVLAKYVAQLASPYRDATRPSEQP